MTSLANSVDPSGRITITGMPALASGFTQNIEGGQLNAAVSKTQNGIATQASHVLASGAGIRGGRRMRGGQITASVPTIPEANSIPGISHAGVQQSLVQNVNQLKADRVYDGLASATPYKINGGFRFREEDMNGGKKRRRKTKKHGRGKRKHTRRNRHGNGRVSSRRHGRK